MDHIMSCDHFLYPWHGSEYAGGLAGFNNKGRPHSLTLLSYMYQLHMGSIIRYIYRERERIIMLLLCYIIHALLCTPSVPKYLSFLV
jgi:hypothetical protein